MRRWAAFIPAVLLGLAEVWAGNPLAAQSVAEIGTPAELPPESFTANQYVDSRGCVFIRAGFGGATTWVPRVGRDRQVLCGYPPSLSLSLSHGAEAAAPLVQEMPQAGTDSDPAAAPAPQPAPPAAEPSPPPATATATESAPRPAAAPTQAPAAAPVAVTVRVAAGDRFLQAGRYADQASARVVRDRLAARGVAASIGRSNLGGRTSFVVLAGPYADVHELGRALAVARAAGLSGAITRP